MKRLFAILILVIVIAATSVSTVAFAAPTSARYLEIDRDNVFLYENTRRAPALFEIPRTYYARIIDASYDPEYLLVEYNGVEGLVKAADVSGKTVTDVTDPYYTDTNISAHINAVLYANPSFESATTLSAYGQTLPYLGKVQGERGTYGTSTWFAVLYGDKVYFLHSAMTENLDLLESAFSPVHPNSVATTAANTEEADAEEKEKVQEDKFDLVRLLLIIGMIVPIVIILFLLFRPKRRRDHLRRRDDRERYDHSRRYARDRYYREEDDYDDD